MKITRCLLWYHQYWNSIVCRTVYPLGTLSAFKMLDASIVIHVAYNTTRDVRHDWHLLRHLASYPIALIPSPSYISKHPLTLHLLLSIVCSCYVPVRFTFRSTFIFFARQLLYRNCTIVERFYLCEKRFFQTTKGTRFWYFNYEYFIPLFILLFNCSKSFCIFDVNGRLFVTRIEIKFNLQLTLNTFLSRVC